jgi:molybdopterin molybdotransferase
LLLRTQVAHLAVVGDHDLVQKTALGRGLDLSFYKIAMRPGKPLMAGHFGKTTLIGLPGNPVSAMVCGHIFLRPIIRKFCGLPFEKLQREVAALKREIGKNGPREHYMRAVVSDVNGATKIEAFERQDSSLLSVLSSANALLVRAPNDSPKPAGTPMEFIRI